MLADDAGIGRDATRAGATGDVGTAASVPSPSTHGYIRMGHTGGDYGVASRMFFRPDRQVGVVSLANSYLGQHWWHAFTAIELEIFDRFS
jgi:hypothetical protein